MPVRKMITAMDRSMNMAVFSLRDLPTFSLAVLLIFKTPFELLISVLYAYLNNRSIFRVYDTADPLPADGGYCIIEL